MLFVTGLTGNTGQQFLALCQESDFPIVTITRDRSKQSTAHVIYIHGDLSDKDLVAQLLTKYPITEMIHIANIRFTPMLMQLAEQYAVKRVIAVHTTGVYSIYQEARAQYEEIEHTIFSQSYHVPYVIVRPTMIYGNDQDHNMHKLIRFLQCSRVFPMFGSGESTMQPVHVEDLAQAIYDIYQQKNIRNMDFDLSGGSVKTYKAIVQLIARELNRSIVLCYVPLTWAQKIVTWLPQSIIKEEQVKRLQEDKAYPHNKATQVFGYQPRSFEQGIRQEITLLKRKGLL
ncbi:nucleoside-diphosphate sugar epimerase [Lysinibacillus alkalisoli]|uniref:Nucleoside-diphosphate sugar epimerase n=1 Tax=Lysinibacillus alkalisoli TaxID=1911548 RepID=A0A917FYT3_9BACI|nr:NAD(P)-dependent oxidoreductase [Lysinibacillus alkalisoli]GGG14524.1 nucleoside-diphosphate sugar epimerase [Lysinibacillus alkalisoli]